MTFLEGLRGEFLCRSPITDWDPTQLQMGCEGPSLTSPCSGMENKLENSQPTTYLYVNLQKGSGLPAVSQGLLSCVYRVSGVGVNNSVTVGNQPDMLFAIATWLSLHGKTRLTSKGVSRELITTESVSPAGWEEKTSISGKGPWAPSSGKKMRHCCFGSKSYYSSSYPWRGGLGKPRATRLTLTRHLCAAAAQ